MNRRDLIKTLETGRKSRLIAYINSDRQPFATKIASDVVPLLESLLNDIGESEKISLFLYTSGGDMLAPIRIVKLIRNKCKKFEIIVPYKAHSAGTLICLGADEIIMGSLGELTPVDPTTGHPFNPQNPQNPQGFLDISVEDLNSFLLFAKDKAEVSSSQMVEVYKLLTEKLHPLAIGNAYRAYRMARLITERLLWLHMDKKEDDVRIKKIIKEITGDITIHNYPIDRDEAIALGLKVSKAKGDLEKQMRGLYEEYANEMKLGQPFHPSELLTTQDNAIINQKGAFLETSNITYAFTYKGRAQRIIRDNKQAFDINLDSQSWGKI